MLGAILLVVSSALAQRGVEQSDGAVRAFEAGEYAQARDAWVAQREAGDRSWTVLYNLACAESMLGNADEGVEYLLDAIGHGFVDFHTMERDPHLAAVREEPRYAAVVENWGKLLDARGEAELAGLMELMGDGYSANRDQGMRVNYVSALGDESVETANWETLRVKLWAEEQVFGPIGEIEGKPSAWVTVIVPTQGDFLKFIRAWGVGGVYDKDQKRLVSRDIGASLRHEFFHVLHWREMERTGQAHPFWIMEGLACVVEDVEDDDLGGFTPVPSWRTNIVKRLARRGLLMKWEELASLPREQFVGNRGRAYYAQSRAIFMYLAEKGKLREWYSAYTAGFDEDPSGLDAIEAVFEMPLGAVQQQFRRWVHSLEEVAEQASPGDAGLGLSIGPGRGDGVVVQQTVAGSRTRPEWIGDERLRKNDVILAIDGEPTPTLDEYYRIIGGYEVGDAVEIDARRGTLDLKVRARLIEEESEW